MGKHPKTAVSKYSQCVMMTESAAMQVVGTAVLPKNPRRLYIICSFVFENNGREGIRE